MYEFDDKWEKKGKLYYLKHPQRSDEWLNARKGRLTSSNFAAAIGDSNFTTSRKLALQLAGIEKKEFTDHQLEIMKRGADGEDMIVDLFQKETGDKVTECSLIVNEDYPYLGGSPDGICKEKETGEIGTIEIKYPDKGIYWPLKKREWDIKNGFVFNEYNHEHIYESHYAQMQGVMLIMGTKWCKYIVYDRFENRIYIEKVLYNDNYCKEKLLKGVKSFFNDNFDVLKIQI